MCENIQTYTCTEAQEQSENNSFPTLEESKNKFLQNFPIPNKGSGKTKNQNQTLDLKSKLERVFDETYIDNPFIDDLPNLSQQENRLRKEIIMQEAKEKCREENQNYTKQYISIVMRMRKKELHISNSDKQNRFGKTRNIII